MLRLSDSLALSREQGERLRARQVILHKRADSIYTILAIHLANLPEKFDKRDAAQRVSDARANLWQIIYSEREFVLTTLTTGQIRLLPAALREMVTTPEYKAMFFAGGFTGQP